MKIAKCLHADIIILGSTVSNTMMHVEWETGKSRKPNGIYRIVPPILLRIRTGSLLMNPKIY